MGDSFMDRMNWIHSDDYISQERSKLLDNTSSHISNSIIDAIKHYIENNYAKGFVSGYLYGNNDHLYILDESRDNHEGVDRYLIKGIDNSSQKMGNISSDELTKEVKKKLLPAISDLGIDHYSYSFKTEAITRATGKLFTPYETIGYGNSLHLIIDWKKRKSSVLGRLDTCGNILDQITQLKWSYGNRIQVNNIWKEMEVLLYFKFNDCDTEYLVYTFNEKLANDEIAVCISKVKHRLGISFTLEDVDDDEYEGINKVLDALAQ